MLHRFRNSQTVRHPLPQYREPARTPAAVTDPLPTPGSKSPDVVETRSGASCCRHEVVFRDVIEDRRF
jgi:hypothetical protein